VSLEGGRTTTTLLLDVRREWILKYVVGRGWRFRVTIKPEAWLAIGKGGSVANRNVDSDAKNGVWYET